MRRQHAKLFAILFLSGWAFPASAADDSEVREEGATILASCVDIVSTGKRHNSYFFTFDVEQVLEGEYREKSFRTREHYHDFGGGQLIQKLGASGIRNRMARKGGKAERPKTVCEHQVVLRLIRVRSGAGGDPAPLYRVLWAVRPGEEEKVKSLETLARTLVEAFKTKKFETIEPWNSPGSGFTRKVFQKAAAYNDEHEWVDFRRMVLGSLLSKRDGRVFIGGGMYKLWFELAWQKDQSRWVIRRVGKS